MFALMQPIQSYLLTVYNNTVLPSLTIRIQVRVFQHQHSIT